MTGECVSDEAFDCSKELFQLKGQRWGENSGAAWAIRSGSGVGEFVEVCRALLERVRLSGSLVFGICCLIVAVVSVHDAALVALNNEVIGDFERNPIGKWLLDLQGGEVWLFIFVKLAATALVCAVLITVYQHCRRYGLVTAAALASFQLLLLCYLSVG